MGKGGSTKSCRAQSAMDVASVSDAVSTSAPATTAGVSVSSDPRKLDASARRLLQLALDPPCEQVSRTLWGVSGSSSRSISNLMHLLRQPQWDEKLVDELFEQLREQGLAARGRIRRGHGGREWRLTAKGCRREALRAGQHQQLLDPAELPPSLVVAGEPRDSSALALARDVQLREQVAQATRGLAPQDCLYLPVSVEVPQSDRHRMGRFDLAGEVALPQYYDQPDRQEEYESVLWMSQQLREGRALPEVLLAHRPGYGLRILDGYHRLSAYRGEAIERAPALLLAHPAWR